MAIQGVDYSWSRPGGAALSAAGFRFAVRYIPYPGDGGKGIGADEVADLHANNVSIVFVFESTQFRPLDGHDAGVADGMASRDALARLGVPDDRPVYFGFDWDVQSQDYAACDAYMDGVALSLGSHRVGAYGKDLLLEHFRVVGLAKWFWQTLAWSGGRTMEGRHLYQELNSQTVNGGSVDWDEAYQEDFGQWPVIGGDMTPAEVQTIVDAATAPLKAQLDRLNAVLVERFALIHKASDPDASTLG